MGTSGSSTGSGSNTPLVPSWLDDEDDGQSQSDNDTDPKVEPSSGSDSDAPPDPDCLDGEDDGQSQPDADAEQETESSSGRTQPRFSSARSNFSRFARSGGNDIRALRRAVRDYARKGTGGSRNAVHRMGASRTAAGKMLGVFRDIQRDGLQETLRRLDLDDLVNGGVQDIFFGLTDIICADGGLIDEATARNSWLETVAELDQLGIDNIDTLSSDQIREMFLNFVANSIKTRLHQEIGVNGFKYAGNLDDIEAFDGQMRDYIVRGVRDSFHNDLASLSKMDGQAIQNIVEKTYQDAWDLFQVWGDAEE